MIIKKLISSVGRSYKISEHFTLGEMACKDGSDLVLYSTELMAKLEELRTYVGGTITINSGYRTASYNRKIGGAALSQHTQGTAADIVVKKNGKVISAKLICCLCQSLGFHGIGYISENAVHVDMRTSGSYRGDERKGYSGNVGGDFYKYFGISKADIEALKPKKETPKPTPKPQEEEKVTQAQFNQMMDTYLKQRAEESPSKWSEDARKWAESEGIIQGTGSGMEYKAFVTREQVMTFLYRFFKRK